MVSEVRERAGVLHRVYMGKIWFWGEGGYWGHPGSKMYISMTVRKSRKILGGGNNLTSQSMSGNSERRGNNQRKYR
jgi:hypothetical protein